MAELPRLSHIDDAGNARMVDVADKAETKREAIARGELLVSPDVIRLLRDEALPKGDALSVARVAAYAGVKRTSELIPLCHPLRLTGIDVDLSITDVAIEINVTCRAFDRTGVEMEALTGVAVAGLTLHDMVKAIDPAAVLTNVRLIAKSGGQSGDWQRP